MGIKEDIKSIISKEGVTMKNVAQVLTEQYNLPMKQSTFSDKLSKRTIKYEEVRAILDYLGYDIKFEKRTK